MVRHRQCSRSDVFALRALRLHRTEERADRPGFSRADADAVGVGRREAFGVRQLAAALSSCPNNVSVTIPRHLQTPFACFAFFVAKTSRTIGRSFPNPLGCMTLFPPAGKSQRPTSPRHAKIHSNENSGPVGLDGDCPNHETHETREKVAVIVRAFSPRIVENDVEMAIVVGLRPTLVWTAPLALP